MNYGAADPGLYFEDSAGAIAKIGPPSYGPTAPNSTPVGSAGNYPGELWTDNSTGSGFLRVWTGSTFANMNVAFASAAGTANVANFAAAASGAVAASVAMGLVWGEVGGWSVTVQRRVNSRLVPTDVASRTGSLGRAHLLAIVTDFLRGAVVSMVGVALGRAGLGVVDARWPVDPSVSTGVLYVGAAVSLGILLHDLGGFRRRRILFVLGLAFGIVGARFL